MFLLQSYDREAMQTGAQQKNKDRRRRAIESVKQKCDKDSRIPKGRKVRLQRESKYEWQVFNCLWCDLRATTFRNNDCKARKSGKQKRQ